MTVQEIKNIITSYDKLNDDVYEFGSNVIAMAKELLSKESPDMARKVETFDTIKRARYEGAEITDTFHIEFELSDLYHYFNGLVYCRIPLKYFASNDIEGAANLILNKKLKMHDD